MTPSRSSAKTPAADKAPGVASDAQNAALEHTDDSAPETTRDDALDVGVPMLQGSPDEPVGPEDALGQGPKRGDYSERQDTSVHMEAVPNPKAGEPVIVDGEVVDYEPTHIMVNQSARVSEVGDVEGKKGGVETAAESTVA